MGYIYEAMDRVKECIEKAFDNNELKYKKIFEIIDRRWSVQLHQELHGAAHYLNPTFFYKDSERIQSDVEVQNGLYKSIGRLVLSIEVQEKISKQIET
jgi:hypothetical protein